MQIHPIHDESDKNAALAEFRALRKQNREPFPLTIKGLPLPEDATKRLEAQIQQMVAAEIDNHEQTGPQVQQAQNVGEQTHSATSTIDVSLAELPLPEGTTKRLEAQIQQMVAAELAQYQATGTTQTVASESCICITNSIPGYNQPLDDIMNLIKGPPPPHGFWTIGIWDSPGGYHDFLLLDLFPNATSPDQCIVGLANSCASCWAKHIWAWNVCGMILSSVHQSGCNDNPAIMTISRGCHQTDTLIFAKPMFQGAWQNLFHFDVTQFWTVFGGTRAIFYWRYD